MNRQMGYIVAAFLVFVTVILLLSAFSPVHTDKPFWLAVKRIKNAMDSVSYVFLTVCLVLSAVVGALYALKQAGII